MFVELVKCLDDRSLSFIIRVARNYGQKTLQILTAYYLGSEKLGIITLYTELKTLNKTTEESLIYYVIRAESTVNSCTIYHVSAFRDATYSVDGTHFGRAVMRRTVQVGCVLPLDIPLASGGRPCRL